MNRLGARDGRRVKTSTAGHASSGSGSPRQRSGVFLSVVNEDQPSGWHATAIPHGRLPLSPGGPKRKRRTRGSGLTAVGSRALPDAGDRPAVERPGDGRIDGGAEPARRRAVSPSGGRGGGAPSCAKTQPF